MRNLNVNPVVMGGAREKTPDNTVCLQEIAELVPSAKFIVVVRDPRRMVNSMRLRRARADCQRRIAADGVWYTTQAYSPNSARRQACQP